MTQAIRARFFALTSAEPNTGCLLWTGAAWPTGYGKFSIRGRLCRAHRVSWEIAHGPIPDGLLVRHDCDTPSCVNPDHLRLGTDAENSRDKVSRGRNRNPIADRERTATHCINGHEFNAANTSITRDGKRNCRVCDREQARRYRRQKKQRAGVDVDAPRAVITITPLANAMP